MHSGILTGKVSRQWLDDLPSNDWRKHKVDHPVVSPLHSKDGLQDFLILQEELRSFAYKRSITIGQLAVCWSLSHSGVTSAIVGARKKGQILETVKAVDSTLSKDEKKELMSYILKFENK
jgi:aryl-alcohol dehydrogenase-like predicted oxidoreductase